MPAYNLKASQAHRFKLHGDAPNQNMRTYSHTLVITQRRQNGRKKLLAPIVAFVECWLKDFRAQLRMN